MTINDLFDELDPIHYSKLNLEHALEIVDQINHTIEVLEEEGHEFEYPRPPPPLHSLLPSPPAHT